MTAAVQLRGSGGVWYHQRQRIGALCDVTDCGDYCSLVFLRKKMVQIRFTLFQESKASQSVKVFGHFSLLAAFSLELELCHQLVT